MEQVTSNIKQEIHQLINGIDDIEFLKAVQTIISAKANDNLQHDLTDEEIQIVEERREDYLQQKGKNYSWDEVKAFAKSSKNE